MLTGIDFQACGAKFAVRNHWLNKLKVVDNPTTSILEGQQTQAHKIVLLDGLDGADMSRQRDRIAGLEFACHVNTCFPYHASCSPMPRPFSGNSTLIPTACRISVSGWQ